MKKHLYQLSLSIFISILFLGVLVKTNPAGAQTVDTTRAGSAVRQNEQVTPGETISPEEAGAEEVVTPFKPYVPDMSITRVWNPLSRLWEPAVIPGESDYSNSVSSCTNSDFSLGNYTNWQGCWGVWASPGFIKPCSNAGMPKTGAFLPGSGRFQLIASPGAPDSFVPAINTVYTGEPYSCRIGNHAVGGTTPGSKTDQLTYPLIMGSDNQFFIYRYAVVLADPGASNHPTPDTRPRFTIEIDNHLTGAVLDSVCGFFDIYPGTGTTGWSTTTYNGQLLYYKDWTTVGLDLSGMTTIGQAVDVVFRVHGCSPGGHSAWAYISAKCDAMTIALAGCEGSGQITFTGPPGFTQYQWQGPFCPTCTLPPPIYTGQSITITTAQGAVTGNIFTLNLTAANGCTVQNVQNVVGFTSVASAFSYSLMCANNISTFTDNSTSSNATQPIVNRQWAFDGGGWGAPTTNPVYTYTFLTPGPHTVSVQSFSQDGCIGTSTQMVNIDPAPAISNSSTTKSICSATNVGLTLEFSPGNDATWTSSVTTGTANITHNPVSQSGTQIDDLIVNLGTSNAVVTYTVTPHINGCNGLPTTFTITVKPTPHLTNGPHTPVCSGAPFTVTLTPDVTGGNFTWTASCSPVGAVTGFTAAQATNVTSINDNLVNTTVNSATVTYLITPHANGCDGPVSTYTVTVYPAAAVNSVLTANWCNNVSNTYNITSSTTSPVPTYSWSRAFATGITPATGAGAGAAITETLVNATPDPILVVYQITPAVNGCPGATASLVVTVNPKPVVNSAMSVKWCNNVSNTYTITSTSTSPGPSYIWTRPSVVGITPSANAGTTDIITETLLNSTPDPIAVDYLIVPSVNGCNGDLYDVSVSVNPTVVITSSTTANWCNNTANTYNITSATSSIPPTFSWTRAAVPGISNLAGSGTGSSITETLINTTPDPVVATYVITPSIFGCPGIPMNVDVTVNPTIMITSPVTENWCNNIPNTYNITSSSTAPAPTYAWSRAFVAGISNSAGSGTGSSITETLVNTTTNPLTVTYVITPTVNNCDGPPKVVNVTVNPTATVTSAITVNWCNNIPNTYNITSGTVPAPIYTWTRAAVPGISNIAGSGTGVSITETLINTTTDPVVATYVIIPTVNGCAGTTQNVNVTVNPTATITSPITANWCSSVSNTYSITSASSLPVPTFTWTRAVMPGITPATNSGTGASITETLANSTANPVVVTYSITPTVNSCAGTAASISVTVNPNSVITSPATANWCNNVSNTYNITSSSATPVPNYAWTRTAVAGITPPTNSGTTAAITETLVNATPDPIAITYVITPTVNNCDGTVKTVTVTVNPTAIITSPATANWCNNIPNTYNITSNSSAPVPIFTWTRAFVAGISNLANSGTGASITETLVNNTTNPVVVTYVITPTVNGCAGTPKTVSVTVNPTSVINSPATANWCNNTPNTYNITSTSTTPVPTFGWNRAMVPGIMPATGSGSGNSITETLVNSTANPVVVHYLVTPTINSCTGTPYDVAVTVNPTAVITSSQSGNWCNSISNTYMITSNSNMPTPAYAWSRAALPGITPATGSGSSADITETLVNSTTDPIVVHYLVTPTVNGCDGTPADIEVTVNPTAIVSSASTENWCSSVPNTYSITSTSTIPAPVFSWTRSAVGGISNPPGSGTGNFITETLINTTVNPIVITYVITPTVNGCAGTQKYVDVTVNPISVITSPVTANWCNNISNTYNIVSSSTAPTPGYTWTRAFVTGIAPATNAGTTAAITETLVNSTPDPIAVIYVITPTVNGCTGTMQNVTVTVNPTSVITSPVTANWCSNVSNSYSITSSSSEPVPVFSWTRAVVAGITNPANAGTGATITETLVNITVNPIVVTYVITPTVNGCAGTPQNVNVTVNPTATITSPVTANWCNSTANTYNITSNSSAPAPTYAWSRAMVAGITPLTGAGSGNSITETLVNATPNPIIVHYLITPTVNSCNGTPIDVAVTVNPTAVITSAVSANWCNSMANTYNITSSSNAPTPAYAWTRAAMPGITPATGAGATAAITETLVNLTTDPVVVHYIITPTVNGCTGTPSDIAVTVNPTAVINSPATANWCSNVPNTYSITSTSSIPTPVFSWTRSAVGGITNPPGAGTGAAITETLFNITANPIVITYVITPTVNGCAGTQKFVDVTVNPIAVITSTATVNWCNNTPNTYNITSSSNLPTPAYTWSRAPVAGITPVTNSGTTAAITETLVNSTTDPISVVYVITPTVNGCTGTTKNVTVTVNPTSVITSPVTVNWCNNTPNTYNITSSSSIPIPSYGWTRAAMPGITPATGAGSGSSITETLVNSTPNPIVVTYVITPTVNSCNGTPQNVSVTVNPTAVVTSPATANWANNVSSTYNITSSTTTPAPSYVWNRGAVAGITPVTGAGTGAVITETLVNSTPDPIVVHYLITPTVNGCTGTTFDLAVTVNPTSVITSPPTANWCNNVSNSYTITSTTVPPPTYNWSRATVTGISNLPGSGTGATITETLVNTTTDPVVVIYVITPVVGGFPGTPANIAVTVNPTAVITSPVTANWCNSILNTYNIASSTNPTPVFTWTRPVVAGITNLAGSGTGAAINETLNNNMVNPVVVTYTITPTINSCDGTPKDIFVTVNPTSVITSPATANWCNSVQNSYSITSSSNAPTPTYAWTRASVFGITPATGAGAGATITESLVNSTADPIVIHYLITPTVNSCNGTIYDVAVTVNPTAVVTSPVTANWCNNMPNTYSISSSSTNPLPAYSWSRAAVPGIIPATGSGTGAAITETLVNSTTDPVVVTYVITPSVNGCTGTPKSISVTVNPTAIVNSTATVNWCNNIPNTYSITSSSTAPTPDYSWTRATVAGITPLTGAGTGASITETLFNATTDPVVVTYVIIPSVNGCAGTPKSIFVTVNPTSVITSPATGNWCNNISNTYNITSSSSLPTPAYTWTRAMVPGITPATGGGAGATITETLVNSTNSPVAVTYVITPTVNSCTGTSKNVVVTVNPTPHLTNTAPLPICSATTFNVTLLSDVTGSDFTWTAACSPVSSITGFTTPQMTNTTTISDLLTNTISTVATVTYTVTPHAYGCSGQPTAFSVNVNPVPIISCAAGQSICSVTPTTAIPLNSTVAGTVYAWSATCPVGNVNPCPVTPGTTNPIPSVTFTNVTNAQQTVTYTITSSFSGCPGTTTTHTVTVNPSPTVTNWPIDQTICSGGTSTLVTLTSNVLGTNYAWTASTLSPISGFTTTGGDFIPTQTLFIPPGNTGFVTYHITPSFTGGPTCAGATTDYKINVNPLPTPVISGSTLVCELQPNVSYTTPSVSGHSYTWTVTGASNVTNANTNTVTVTWGPYTASPGTLTVTETIDATGCIQATALYHVILQQRPIPTLTGPQVVCDGYPGNLYQTDPGMSTYTWAISGGSITAGGGNGNATATVTWNTTGTQWIQVNYVNSLGCPGYPDKQIPVTVNVLPNTTITEGTGPNCESASHIYEVPFDPLCGFTWSVAPAGRGVVSGGQGTNSVTIDWQTFGSATISVTGTNNTTSCMASSTHTLTIHPKPIPAFNACFDLLTTPNAKKFVLRGASPVLQGQGVFTGNRVSFNALTGNYEFDPFGAITGSYPITYTFTNNYGCSATAGPVTINIVNTSFSCGGLLTDVRDGKTYKTSMVGGRCWMEENLSYGTTIDSQTLPQTDNCINEKFCLPSDATCSQYGGFYQWDELLRYASTSANQGICPPEWHVPSDAEWQVLVNNISLAGIIPADALSGSFMKDPLLNPGFIALLKGFFYLNNTWSFSSGSLTATMYWTSTSFGTDRALARGVNIFNPSTSRYDGSRGNAFPVRCIKDTP